MPLDFSQLNTNAPQQLAAALDPTVAVERNNRLAALAQGNALRDIQVMQGVDALNAMPQQRAEAQRAKEAKYMQGVAAEVAANPQNKDAILERHAQQAEAGHQRESRKAPVRTRP